MKKIIAILVISLISNQLIAQTSSPTAAAKVASIEESKKTNANAQTMINGIPYSQYKAQQEAKAKKQDVQPVTNFQKPKGLEQRIVTTNDAKATPAVSNPVNTKGTSIEVKQVNGNN